MSRKNEEKLMTSHDAAKILGYSQDYIRSLCMRGKIKATKFGNTWIFAESAIKDLKPKKDIEYERKD
jgi:excisionase family DNA binding protein